MILLKYINYATIAHTMTKNMRTVNVLLLIRIIIPIIMCL